MKVLVMPQPWALLMCCGICDVVTVNKYFDYRGKVLIAARGKDFGLIDDCYEWTTAFYNAETFGNIPSECDWEYDCIIGSVEVVDCTEESQSSWHKRRNNTERYMRLKDARLFNIPIYDVEFQEDYFFESEDLDDVSCHDTYKRELRAPKFSGEKYVIPVNETLMDEYTDRRRSVIDIYLSEEFIYSGNFSDFTEEELREIKVVELQSPTRMSLFRVKQAKLCSFEDKDGETVILKSVYNNEEKILCESLSIEIERAFMWK